MAISLMPDSTSVLIMRDDFKILACSRKDDPEAFGLPGGKVDLNDETFALAAFRELAEETGVVMAAPNWTPWHSGICKGSTNYMNHTFLVTTYLKYNLTIEPRQVEGEGRVAWIPPLLLLYGPFADYNKILLEKIGYMQTSGSSTLFGSNLEVVLVDGTAYNDCTFPSRQMLLDQIEVCSG